jgi:hypothetical protein
MAHNKQRRVEYNCKAGVQFQYVCDDCSLELYGFNNKNEVPSVNGWTWELKRNGEEIDSAGTKWVRKYGGTEQDNLREGLKRFYEEPCIKIN